MLPSTPVIIGDGDLITGIPACELRKGLFIGGLTVLKSAAELGISHVLSVINDMPDLTTRVWQLSMKHMLIDMPDMAEANLLPHFQQAVKFISSAIGSNGKVLVHCQAGVSRSACVVLAYLMTTERTSMESALASVRHVYPYASPNEGFLQQLQLWQEMGYVFKPDHPGYNLVTMRQLAMRYDAGEEIASITANLAVPSESTPQGMLYRCRKCRRLLATQNNVVPVSEGPGSIAFKHRKRSKVGSEQGEDRGSLWVEPMQWMQELSDGATQGKLYCPGCKARLGSFNWAGSQSESGAWVTPAFQLHHSKVDAMSAQAAAPLNIRRPLIGPTTTRSTSKSRPTAAQEVFVPMSQTDSVQQQPEDGEANSLEDDSVVPVDAARTVSEAAHCAALIASEINRPAVVPRNDSKHPHLDASVVR
ncbi:hypothetical protein WJX77_003176 [Trebouxia sp. C0004]